MPAQLMTSSCRGCEAPAHFSGGRTSCFAFKPAASHPWSSRRTNVLRKALSQEQRCTASPARHQLRGSCTVASAASATADGGAGAGQPAGVALGPIQRMVAFQQAFWKFLRPHTIRGTILGSIAVTARALIESPVELDWGLLPRAMLGVLALLAGNGYIVGINQVYDVNIDKVNKPFLPVAAGELSPVVAWALCIGLAASGLVITAANFGREITMLYAFGLFLGTIYSVPPLRLKRFAVSAFMIIATVRGFLLNFGVYSATRAALGLSFKWSPAILFITCSVITFATVIAITKDLPDVEGDRKYGIETLSTRMGTRAVAFLGSGLLAANYITAITLALRMQQAFRVPLMVGANVLFCIYLWYETARVDAAKYTQPAIAAYYRGIWNLFYAQYAVLPFI